MLTGGRTVDKMLDGMVDVWGLEAVLAGLVRRADRQASHVWDDDPARNEAERAVFRELRRHLSACESEVRHTLADARRKQG